ncbi:MAG TPA: carbohydrate-binding family 9-like protein [Prolixibacteraceae bacterium]|nr:carbohydrate-binding family 9-like protein [Prolixibacteraceae bacterium]
MNLNSLIIGALVICLGSINSASAENPPAAQPLLVKKGPDFSITGNGSNSEWDKATWNKLIKLDPEGEEYPTRFKILYSGKGIYLLFEGKDNKITTKFDKDFDNLFNGYVFEVFFHPDPKMPLYFEYEINPLNKELVLIIPNLNGKIHGWIPWHYENDRRVVKQVNIEGGKMEAGGTIKSWNAELFFPYELFNPLSNVPPVSGTIWNANFYRLDYDSGKMVKWAWMPINQSFHEFEKFKPIKFE